MYDPTDERVDEVFSLLVHLIRTIPDNLAKQSMAKLFEEGALREVLLLEGEPMPPDEEAVCEAMARYWDRVESLRNDHAAAFLNAIQREEF
jgi:hypothetical protein